MGGEVKLIFLQKRGEQWEFKTESHARFDAFLEGTMFPGNYTMRKVLVTHGPGYYYEISDEGMWLLRPHFSNWDEMEAQVYRRHRYDKEGYERVTCSACHKDGHFAQCPCCQQWYCSACLAKHQAQKRTYQCHFCHAHFEQDSLKRCASCHAYHCRNCDSTHVIYHAFHGNDDIHIDFGGSFYEHIFRSTYFGFDKQTTTGTVPPVLPYAVREACTLLGLATNTRPTIEDIRGAFRAKVRAAADGHGGYTGDMDKLTKAKEQLLSFVGKG